VAWNLALTASLIAARVVAKRVALRAHVYTKTLLVAIATRVVPRPACALPQKARLFRVTLMMLTIMCRNHNCNNGNNGKTLSRLNLFCWPTIGWSLDLVNRGKDMVVVVVVVVSATVLSNVFGIVRVAAFQEVGVAVLLYCFWAFWSLQRPSLSSCTSQCHQSTQCATKKWRGRPSCMV